MKKSPVLDELESEKPPQGLEPEKAVDVSKLIMISEGSVVSRVLVKSETGSITLFAFDKDQALSEHTAPYHAMVQVLEGSVELTIGGKKRNAHAGQSTLMPAEIPHSVKALTPLKMLLTMIKPS